MAPLNTVIFDLWQTLIIDYPEPGRLRVQKRLDSVSEVLSTAGFHFTQDQLTGASQNCYRVCDGIREQEGDVSFDEQVDIFINGIDEGLLERISDETRTHIARRYADSYLEHPPLIADGAKRVVRALKEMGYKVGMICNTGSTPGVTQRVFLDRMGLLPFFDTLTFSDEERLSKPSTEIFHRTLDRLMSSSAESVHVGDHPRNDVEGAKRAGLRAIWLRRDGAREPDVAPDATIETLEETLDALSQLTA